MACDNYFVDKSYFGNVLSKLRSRVKLLSLGKFMDEKKNVFHIIDYVM